jgi:hypothetical protein
MSVQLLLYLVQASAGGVVHATSMPIGPMQIIATINSTHTTPEPAQRSKKWKNYDEPLIQGLTTAPQGVGRSRSFCNEALALVVHWMGCDIIV